MPEKHSGLYGIQTLDLCDTGAALYQLSQQANWGQVIELVRYKPVKQWGEELYERRSSQL